MSHKSNLLLQADNEGILTIATTNHPERIDDAILNRPSRFDVKYNFTLPEPRLRTAFAIKWLAKVNALAAETGAKFDKPEETADAIAAKTVQMWVHHIASDQPLLHHILVLGPDDEWAKTVNFSRLLDCASEVLYQAGSCNAASLVIP